MPNKRILTIGIMAVVVLTVFYLGNMVMRTTPDSDAIGIHQYKVDTYNGDGVELEKILNDNAKDGWEYVGTAYNGRVIIFEK